MKTQILQKLAVSLALGLVCLMANGQIFTANVTNANYPQLNDGSIVLQEISNSGLVNPIGYLWSNGETMKNIFNLSNGIYTLTFTDASNYTGVESYEVGITNNNYQYPWFVLTSPVSHTINIPGGNAVSIKGQNLLLGDEIGVMYDSLGFWACAGSIVWNGSSQILTVYGDSTGLSGFGTNEEFRYVIRSQMYGYDFIAEPSYDLSGSFANDSLFTQNGVSGLLSLHADSLMLQTIRLAAGENDFVSYFDPLESYTPYVFDTLLSSEAYCNLPLSWIASSTGQIYWPAYGFYLTLINILPGVVYEVHTACSCKFQIVSYWIDTTYIHYNHRTCFNTQDGLIWVEPNFGTPPYTYLWSDGTTDHFISDPLLATPYSITITDATSITDTLQYTTQTGYWQQPVVYFSVVNSIPGNSTGKVHVDVGSFFLDTIQNFMWSTGALTDSIFNVPAGNYFLTIENSNGCIFDTSVTISNTSYIVDIYGTNTSNDTTNDASAWVEHLYLNPPYTYQWSTGATIDSISALAPGTYYVTVTDNLGESIINYIILTNPLTISTYVLQVTPPGFNNGYVSLTVSGGLTPYVYQWSNGISLNYLFVQTPGIYSVTVTDQLGNSISENFILNAFEINFNCIFPTTSTSCDGEIDISVLGGIPPFTFAWSNGEGTEDVANLCTGFYSVIVTDSTGISDSITVNLNNALIMDYWVASPITSSNHTVIIQATTPVGINGTPISSGDYIGVLYESGGHLKCAGYTQYTGSVAIVTVWGTDYPAPLNNGYFPGETFKWFIYDVSESSIHYVHAEYDSTMLYFGFFAPNGLSSLTSLGVTQTPLMTNLNYNPIDCNAFMGSATFTPPPLYTGPYIWTSGLSTASINNLTAGWYGITVLNPFLQEEIFYFEVTASPPIEIVASITDATYGNNGSINITVSGGNPPYTYAWSNYAATEDISLLFGNVYTVSVFDSDSCTITETFTVSWITSPLAISEMHTDVDCYGNCNGSIDLTATGGSTPYIFSWSNGSTTEDLSNLCAGNYSVTITDNNLDTASLSLNILQPDPIVLTSNITNETYNPGNDGAINLTVTGGTSPYNFAWSNGAATEDISSLIQGTYSLTITDANACTNIETFEVDLVYFYANIFHANSPVFNDGYIKLFGGGPLTTPISFNWSNGASTKNIFNLSPGIYTVTYTDAINQSGTQSFEVGVTNNNYPFPWFVATSTLAHTIQIPGGNAVTVKGQNLMPGDQVGVFYDSLGYWACGGSIIWTGSAQTLAVYGDTVGNSGFEANEQFRFLIRSQLYGYDFIASPAYDLSGTYLNDSTFTNGGSSGVLSLVGENLILQSALLSQGWNNFFINHPPVNPNAVILFSTVVASVKIVKAAYGGLLYWPQYGLNNIGSMQTGTLYQTDMYFTDVVQFPCILSNTALYQIKTNTCYNVPDGFIEINASFGLPPYTYSWNTGATTSIISNIPPNTNYSVTVTDALMVQQSLNFTSGQGNESPIMNFNITNATGTVGGSVQINGYIGSFWPGVSNFYWSTGSTDNMIIDQPAGTYNLTIESNFGCLFDTTVTISNATFNVDLLKSDISCFGANDGSVWLDNLAGVSPYSFLWSTGATSDSISGLAEGNYSVTIIDNTPDTVMLLVDIINPTEIEMSYIITDNTGTNNGAVDITVWGGTPPYSFNWSNGATTGDISALSNGLYSLTIEDANACPLYDGFVVSSPPPPAFSATGIETDIDCYGDCTGTIDLTVTGGYTPYTYSWSNGDTTEDLANLCAGTYSVTVSDFYLDTQNLTIGISQPAQIDITSIITLVSTSGAADGAIDLTVTGGTSPYNFEWSNGATTEDISSLSQGAYSITLNDANLCSAIESFIVDLDTSINASASITDIPCYGDCTGAIDLTVTGGTSPYSFIWSNSETTEDVSGLCAGNYMVNVFETANLQLGNAWPWSYTITGSNHVILVQSGTLTLNGSSPPVGSMVGVFYDDGGVLKCGGYSAWTGSNIAITAWVDDSGTPIKDGFDPGEIFNWQIYSGGVPYVLTAQYNLVFPNSDTYTNNGVSSVLSLISATGNFNSFYFTVNQANELIISSVITPVDPGVGNDGAIDLTVVGGTTPYSFEWSNGETGEDISALSTGTYSLTLTDANACAQIDTFEVSTQSTGALAISGIVSNVVCYGACNGNIDLSVTGGTTPYSFLWSNGATSGDLDNLCPGSYLVNVFEPGGTLLGNPWPWAYTNTGSNHTILIQAGTVTIDGLPAPSGSMIGVFYDDNGVLECGGYVEWTGATTGMTAWGDDSGSSDKDGFATGESFNWQIYSNGISYPLVAQYLTMPNGGNYVTNGTSGILSLQATVPLGASYNFTVTEPDSIEINYTITDVDPAVLNNGAIDLTISGGTLPYNFAWSNGATTEDLMGLSAGMYFLTFTDANMCSYIDSFVVTNLITNQLSATSNSDNINCYGVCNGLINLSVSGGNSMYSYFWSNGETSVDIDSLCAGNYEITIIDQNSSFSTLMPWSYSTTGPSHAIIVPFGVPILDGNTLLAGDYLGVFYDNNGSLECAGYGLWNGITGTVIAAFGDDAGPGKNGFDPGEAIFWKTWRASDGAIVDMLPVYRPLTKHFYQHVVYISDVVYAAISIFCNSLIFSHSICTATRCSSIW
ncbi:MAG: SprB repeat-containing protein, partial [Bacteroidales bacterium]|nr:SprB repeat-containing protein [Bacteroidales bacterium]MCF8458378.1 SprB repeat-containing protein [Bacteroidales bacterium]